MTLHLMAESNTGAYIVSALLIKTTFVSTVCGTSGVALMFHCIYILHSVSTEIIEETCSVELRHCYRKLVVHGFPVDEDRKKMSKSEGNVIDPVVVVNGGKVSKYS